MVVTMAGGNSIQDRDLVARCLKRDPAAWILFARKYSRLITLAVNARLRRAGVSLPAQDVEDLQQDVLTSIWKERKLEQLRDVKNLAYWLAAVASNETVDYLRRKAALDPAPLIPFIDISDDDARDIVPAHMTNARDLAMQHEFSGALADAITSLSSTERLVMKLLLFYGKKQDEIAKFLRIPRGTVSSHVVRAKEKLQKRLRDYRSDV